ALAPVNHEVSQNESLNAVEIPGVAWRVLVVPLQVAGIRFDGEDGTYIEVLLALRFTELFGPWAAITGTDINKIGIGVVRNAIPDGAATTDLPPVAGPGLCSFFQRWLFKRFRRVAGNRIEPPQESAGVRIERREESAHRILGTTY